ncbi:hypothetical protein TSAR_007879 [Trichomalopsis sarcophagae]|uniref:Uncharacterized protein n=1 Tax=Trichomalopsis sarcophagae TaxID=543379 RepID=A0A232EYR4_9HYME|nr:hypothetical protein TSAR_007879 [Trichomalopsis sarcophagae]
MTAKASSTNLLAAKQELPVLRNINMKNTILRFFSIIPSLQTIQLIGICSADKMKKGCCCTSLSLVGAYNYEPTDPKRCQKTYGRRKRAIGSGDSGEGLKTFYKFIENQNSCVPFEAPKLPELYGFFTQDDCDKYCRDIYEYTFYNQPEYIIIENIVRNFFNLRA